MERNVARTVRKLKKFINYKIENFGSGPPPPPQRSTTRWTQLFILPETAPRKDDHSVRLLVELGGRFLRYSLISFCVLNTLITQIGYPACVYGKSMQPELNGTSRAAGFISFLRTDLDWVWLSCWRAKSFLFNRGDIVAFVSPKDPYDYLIKRVIGVEGDTVTSHLYPPIKIRVPKGHVWVEGDNWNKSVDSNKYGPIPVGLVVGVATHVICPLDQWRRLKEGIPERLIPDRVEYGATEEKAKDQPARSWLQRLKIFFYFINDR